MKESIYGKWNMNRKQQSSLHVFRDRVCASPTFVTHFWTNKACRPENKFLTLEYDLTCATWFLYLFSPYFVNDCFKTYFFTNDSCFYLHEQILPFQCFSPTCDHHLWLQISSSKWAKFISDCIFADATNRTCGRLADYFSCY